MAYPFACCYVRDNVFRRHKNHCSIRAIRPAASTKRQAMTTGLPLPGAFLADGDFTVSLACPQSIAFASAHGHSDIIGRSLFDVFASVLNEGAQAEYEQVRHTGLPHCSTHRRNVDGSPVVLEIRKIPMQSATSGIRILTTVHNITSQTEQEKNMLQAQKLDSLGVLAGGIAHEFNNLLGGIFGNLNLARRHVETTQTQLQNYLDRAAAGFDRARHLTQQLLTFSKNGAPVKKNIAIGPVCEAAMALVIPDASRQLKCELIVPPDLPMVFADANQIRQVVTNLLLNACQELPSGGRIVIRASHCAVASGNAMGLKPGAYVKLSVADNGPGIDASILDRIFDPFFSTRTVSGGLGLATAHSIVTQHGGRIVIETTATTGTDVSFYLQAAPDVTAQTSPGPSTRRIASNRILLLEDDALLQMVTGELLKRLGWQVEAVSTGAEAIDRFTEAEHSGAPFGVVIFDLTIEGGMGGLEAMTQLKQRFPHICGIVSSGYADSPVLSQPEKYGFCACLIKPFQSDELMNVLQQVRKSVEQDIPQ
ncbi:MAG: response regulator [Deltaproteobacteria bacterium]|nr:response regulator [Deltaproteobacteria bacterium]